MTVLDADGEKSRRSEFVCTVIYPVWDGIKQTVAQALGKGGKFLVPYVIKDRIYVASLDQTRCIVNGVRGDGRMTSLTVTAEIKQVGNTYYSRIIDYTLEGDTLSVIIKALDGSGNEVPLDTVEEWALITPEFTAAGIDRIPVAFLKCPKDNREEDSFYGVPITYGCGDTIRQLHELARQIENEYEIKKAFVGADEFLFGKDGKLPENGLFRKFSGSPSLDGKSFWEVFDPGIRDSSYYARYSALALQLEKEVGTSRGILTEPSTYGATATEIKSANHDTFCLVSDIRKNIQRCMEDLVYSVDMYAELFSLTPSGAAGRCRVSFDWDMSLAESSRETFEQLSELESRGIISSERLNSWVTGQSVADAREEIENVRKEQTRSVSALISPEDPEP